MAYKPSDFFVGVMDFFSILLPGALLVFLGREFAADHIFVAPLPHLRNTAEGWVAFIFASYLVGQFTFLISATFMDRLYDHTYLKYKRRRGDGTFAKAKEMQGANAGIAGALKWANVFVRIHSAAMAEQLDQLEATSKFFRSVTVVLAIFAFRLFLTPRPQAALICVALVLLSFWRFANQRWKFTELAYLCFIQLNAAPAVDPHPISKC
jgi:hypothetical protein